MQLLKFMEAVDLAAKPETERATLLCFYHYKEDGETTFTMAKIVLWLEECNFSKPNTSRLKEHTQMLQHFYCENGFLQEEVVGTRDYNLQQSYSCAERVNLFSDDYTGNIQSVLFEGVKRGVFSAAKFDSRPELVLARVLETDTDVQNWLRPAPQEFNITYNHGHNYEPDFVVETDDTVYLVEVKGEDKLSDPDVIAKKRRGIHYCEVASRWGKANGYKQWKYLFIPSKQIMPNSSFMQLAKMFQTM